MRYDLVIFDNDGVLVDSEVHAQRITAALISELGVPMTPAECEAQFLGASLATIRAWVEARVTVPGDFEAIFHARLFEAFASGLTAVPGVVDALDGLRVPTCVASSGAHERIRVSLAATGLLRRFEGRIFSAQDVARGKPAPDLFLHAARACGVAPARCAVIEDSRAGVEAANAAGMTAFGFARVTPASALRHARGGVFTAMRELAALLDADGA
jgi:HAD superfamily hydrolase (TIGR01509 family)